VDERSTDAGPDQREHRDEGRVRKSRHADHQAGNASRNRKAPPEHEQAEQAADPDGAGRQVKPVERQGQAAGRRLRRVAGEPWDEQRRPGGEQRAHAREQLGNRALGALGPVDPERQCSCEHEERKGELEIEQTTTERRVVHQRQDVPEVEDRAERELRSRHHDVHGSRDQRDHRSDAEGDRHGAEPCLRDAPHDRTRGRDAAG